MNPHRTNLLGRRIPDCPEPPRYRLTSATRAQVAHLIGRYSPEAMTAVVEVLGIMGASGDHDASDVLRAVHILTDGRAGPAWED